MSFQIIPKALGGNTAWKRRRWTKPPWAMTTKAKRRSISRREVDQLRCSHCTLHDFTYPPPPHPHPHLWHQIIPKVSEANTAWRRRKWTEPLWVTTMRDAQRNTSPKKVTEHGCSGTHPVRNIAVIQWNLCRLFSRFRRSIRSTIRTHGQGE